MKKLNPKLVRLSQNERLYQYDKPIIALTGGIATGKSTVTNILEAQGLEIVDADRLVKEIYATDEAKKFIASLVPEAVSHDEIKFKKLREVFFSDNSIKAKVEKFIYQRLPDAFQKAAKEIKNQDFYIYDVPLLFERGLEQLVDQVIVVYAPAEVQLARVMDRDKSTEEIAKKILDQQMDIEAKKLKGNFVINNAGSMAELTAEVEKLLRNILSP